MNMAFSHKDTRSPCMGATACPCPNHLADSACLPAIFSDVIGQNSPLHPILFGNDYLSPAEENLIESSIADLQLKTASSDNSARNLRKLRQSLSCELKKIDWELQRLELHGDALASAIERRKKVARCGIRRLPSEVLAHILFLTIEFPLHDGKLPPIWPRDPLGHELMKFERVSRNWRECIVNNPILWSRILIVADWKDEYWRIPDSVYATRLARQIRCSRQAPLDIIITMCSIHNEVPQLPNMVEHLLAPVSHRIQSLHLFIPAPLIRGLHPLRKSFDALKELYICVDNAAPSLPSNAVLDLFVEAPNLTLYETRNVADPSAFGIPWHQIIRYSSSSSRKSPHFLLGSVLGILSAAGSLQEAAFRTVAGSPSSQIVSTSIVCAHLASLTFTLPRYAATHPIRQVFELCSFPVLAALDVIMAPTYQYFGVDEYDNGSETFRALLDCIQRSRSPLCTLTFAHARVASAEVEELFRTAPNLEYLQLTSIPSGINSDVIQSLCVQENGVIPLPRLHTLHLDGHLTFDLGFFVQMVKGRWGAAPLLSITLGWCGSTSAGTAINRHHRRTLRRMREQRESQVAVLIAELKVYELQGMALQTGLNGWKY